MGSAFIIWRLGMSVTSVSHVALPSFEEFANGSSPDDLKEIRPGALTCLADFIEAWVRSGHGVYACNGEFETYLGIVIAIIEMWLTDPRVLDYVPIQGSGQPIIERRLSS